MVAPTDKSTPAVSRTKVMPMATIAVDDACTPMFMRFCPVKNCGESTPKTASTTAKSTTGDVVQREQKQP